MKQSHAIVALILIAPALIAVEPPAKAELVEVRKIWDHGGHNAFTDLVRFKGNWFCVFREASAHVAPDGAVRLITSRDGKEWQSAAVIARAGYDLRDPKITQSPDGRLMILGGATVREGNKPATESQSFTTFSANGTDWSPMEWAGPTNHWLWRVTWLKDRTYGVAYDVEPTVRNARQYTTRLLLSADGAHYVDLVPRLCEAPGTTEATLRFAKDGMGFCLQRRDGQPNTALLGESESPYVNWRWRDLGKYFGGPNFIQLPDHRWIAVGRLQNFGTPPTTKTVVCELDTQRAELRPLLALPSGGDSSYPGLVLHKGLLWISYYSSHEGKTSVYLAKVRLPKAAK